MINKEFANSFREKMKETANKEEQYKKSILNRLNNIYDILDRIYVRTESIEKYVKEHYN